MAQPSSHTCVANITLVDTEEIFATVCEKLRQVNAFSFDTEFDRFYREYGFKLSLLQIFDGDACWLIDPIALKNLQPVWDIFEDERICKVAYSCSEDIQILKVNGCFPKNIYDIQIAAKLCNHPANSLSALMEAVFNMPPDKSMQKSDWRKRPLRKEQILYAGNDVRTLLTLKEMFVKLAVERGVKEMISEENKACEQIPVTEFKVRLSHVQRKKYNHATQKILLGLLLLRNEIAIEYNVPPATVVSDGTLENILENKTDFLKSPFSKGFSRRLTDDVKNKKRFIDLIADIKEFYVTAPTSEAQVRNETFPSSKEIVKEKTEGNYDLLYEEIIKRYGKESGEYILRGYKKLLNANPLYKQEKPLKKYQQVIIAEVCSDLGIDLKIQ